MADVICPAGCDHSRGRHGFCSRHGEAAKTDGSCCPRSLAQVILDAARAGVDLRVDAPHGTLGVRVVALRTVGDDELYNAVAVGRDDPPEVVDHAIRVAIERVRAR